MVSLRSLTRVKERVQLSTVAWNVPKGFLVGG